MIIVDASVLSRAFRRRATAADDPFVSELRVLVASEALLGVPGIVVQELLSGVTGQDSFERLRADLEALSIVLATETTHVTAARIFNACLLSGVAVTAAAPRTRSGAASLCSLPIETSNGWLR